MKRVIISLMILAMILAGAMSVHATDAEIEVQVRASKTEVAVGDTVEFTVLATGTGVVAMQFNLEWPEGLTYVPNSGATPENLAQKLGVPAADWTELSKMFTFYNDVGITFAKGTEILRFTCVAEKEGEWTVNLYDLWPFDENFEEFTPKLQVQTVTVGDFESVGGTTAPVVPDEPTSELPDETITDVPDTTKPNGTTTVVPEASTPAVPDDSTTEAPDDSTTEVPDDSGTEAPDDSTTEVPDDSGTEAPDDSTTEVPDDSTTEAPDTNSSDTSTESQPADSESNVDSQPGGDDTAEPEDEKDDQVEAPAEDPEDTKTTGTEATVQNQKVPQAEKKADEPKKGGVWIIPVIAAVLIGGGVVVFILIKKKNV